MSSNKHFAGEIDITESEFENISKALKNDEFKKLFFEYCEELQDPENKKKYESEITQLEAERGVQVTFLNPEPGFVIKTSVDGNSKGFINVCKCDKIGKPSNDVRLNSETGKKGLSWNIPFAQAPPRHDVDNKGARCIVYDVLFHPDAVYLAEKNTTIRKHLIDTACDAVEREFHVKLDRTNLKYPKLKFKGVPRATVVRKICDNALSSEEFEPSPIDAIYPPLPSSTPQAKSVTTKSHKSDEYSTPKYVIKHRRGVDIAEMTYELDAKLNVTLPKELVVEIELPLLKSTSDCALDVNESNLSLISKKPAKYKLALDLPYCVDDKKGSAKFDIATRKLTIILPVKDAERQRNMRDLYREDSGVESDVREDVLSSSNVESQLVEVLESRDNAQIQDLPSIDAKLPFLLPNIHYNFPLNFDCNILDQELALVLHIKNVDPQSVAVDKADKSAHVKFTSIGAGYYPTNYAFYFKLKADTSSNIVSAEAEAWDNNVVVTITVDSVAHLNSYFAGLDAEHLKEYKVFNKIEMPNRKLATEDNVGKNEENKSPEVSVKQSDDGKAVEINIINKTELKDTQEEEEEVKSSDSSPDRNSSEEAAQSVGRKQRSYSECRDNGVPICKGILKRHSRYDRTVSESSSIDDHSSSYSCSVDVMRIAADSIGDIPEENSTSEGDGLSESCKKTVRFNEVIQRQLFRLHSSILGQRKKNQKRKSQKLKARQRRLSEGDSADYEDNKSPNGTNAYLKKARDRSSSEHDSGLDISDGNIRSRADSESTDAGSKNSLMFELEM